MDREPLAEGLRPEADFCRLEAEPSRFLSEKTPNNKMNNLLFENENSEKVFNPLVHSSYKQNILPQSYAKTHFEEQQTKTESR